MGWFDDAKDKAEEAAEDTRRKAAEEAGKAAGKAAVSAATSAARKSVGALFEGFVSSAEASLEAAQTERGHSGERNQVLDGFEATLEDDNTAAADDGDDGDEPSDRPQRSGPSLEERLAAMRAEQAAAEPEPEPAIPEPQQTNFAPESLGPVQSTPSDPMAKAMAALDAARRARGVDLDTVPDPPPAPKPSGPADPLAAVDEALARAAAARQHARSGGRAAQAREDAARAQLAALKSGSTSLDAPDESPKHHEDPSVSPTDDDVPDRGPAPKKRSL